MLFSLPDVYAALASRRPGARHGRLSAVGCFCQAAALLGIGQCKQVFFCKQFYEHFLGLLKRANYAKQKSTLRSLHLIRTNTMESRFCGMKAFAGRALHAVSPNSSTPGPPRSRTCTDPGGPPCWACCSSASSPRGKHRPSSGAGASRRQC